MSTTSTVHRSDITRQRFEVKEVYSDEPNRFKRKIKHGPSKKRSNERVTDALSSFIAEFSYLTNGDNAIEDTSHKQIRSQNAYPNQSSVNDEAQFNKHNKNGLKKCNYDRRKKYVDWIDQEKQYPYRKKKTSFHKEMVVETSEENIYSKPQRNLNYEFEYSNTRYPKDQYENGYISVRSSSKNKCKPWNTLEAKNFKIRDNENQKKFSPKERNVRHHVHPYHGSRIKASKSRVRHWPFRYEKERPRLRAEKLPVVKKEKYVPVQKKVEDSSEPAAVVTLYPKNLNKSFLDRPDEVDFLADPKLPCKCVKCMKKFVLLQQKLITEPKTLYFKPKNSKSTPLFNDKPRTPNDQHKQCTICTKKFVNSFETKLLDSCCQLDKNHLFVSLDPQLVKCTIPCEQICCYSTNNRIRDTCFNNFWECPKDLLKCLVPFSKYRPSLDREFARDCCKAERFEPSERCHVTVPCPYSREDECVTSDLNNCSKCRRCDEPRRETSYNTIYLRFDCVGRQINPVVTQYFESVLNNKS